MYLNPGGKNPPKDHVSPPLPRDPGSMDSLTKPGLGMGAMASPGGLALSVLLQSSHCRVVRLSEAGARQLG